MHVCECASCYLVTPFTLESLVSQIPFQLDLSLFFSFNFSHSYQLVAPQQKKLFMQKHFVAIVKNASFSQMLIFWLCWRWRCCGCCDEVVLKSVFNCRKNQNKFRMETENDIRRGNLSNEQLQQFVLPFQFHALCVSPSLSTLQAH